MPDDEKGECGWLKYQRLNDALTRRVKHKIDAAIDMWALKSGTIEFPSNVSVVLGEPLDDLSLTLIKEAAEEVFRAWNADGLQYFNIPKNLRFTHLLKVEALPGTGAGFPVMIKFEPSVSR